MHDSPDLLRISAPDAASRVAALLARAFQYDPLMCYVIPNAEQRQRLLPYLISLNVRYAMLYGEVYATQGFEGVAVWLPPGRTAMTPWRMAHAGMFAAPLKMPWPALRRLARVGAHTASLHERCAPGPHWYLSQIGVEPSRQRQGIGSRLLAPMSARIDAAGLPCYLETENPANVPFYQRHGFRVVAESAARGGGPRVYSMLRTG
ncbi:MAG: hypothetical protein OJF49_002279 [Ktedonobacterales bacterium]|jgi:ribosomal protein S18 acetylase RimI-like enzyme|nr:MAG: hypothetical protein OJF49_002279 [Ktedonobacterales bacterium]